MTWLIIIIGIALTLCLFFYLWKRQVCADTIQRHNGPIAAPPINFREFYITTTDQGGSPPGPGWEAGPGWVAGPDWETGPWGSARNFPPSWAATVGRDAAHQPEVFNVKDNAYYYDEADSVCRHYGARLATKEEVIQAQYHGANWCQLGWVEDQQAYFPLQAEQVAATRAWPREQAGACGREGLNGGVYPTYYKLGVNCYGLKPFETHNLNPWNTVTYQWSKASPPIWESMATGHVPSF